PPASWLCLLKYSFAARTLGRKTPKILPWKSLVPALLARLIAPAPPLCKDAGVFWVSMRVSCTEAQNTPASIQSGGAGAISLASKAGTNDFHGSIFGVFRPNVLAANEYFNKQSQLAGG